MSNLTNVTEKETITVNYNDSAVSNNLKLKKHTGTGEKRIYIGNAKTSDNFDLFFFYNTNNSCYISKNDLLIYLRDAYYEYHFPVQDYKNNISSFYRELISLVKSLPERIEIYFTKTHDKKQRYYLVCQKNSRKNLRILSEICLPKITEISFVRFFDTKTNKIIVQLRPFFYRSDLTGSNHPNYYKSNYQVRVVSSDEHNLIDIVEFENKRKNNLNQTNFTLKVNNRPWQNKWRNKVLKETIHCAISKCEDERILEACHIKPVANCLQDKSGDETNANNGIMLTPTFHKLFDDGFISFDNNNTLLLSTHINSINFEKLNIQNNQSASICNLKSRIKFLEWHRKTIFKG